MIYALPQMTSSTTEKQASSPGNLFDGMVKWKVDGRKKIMSRWTAFDVSQEWTDDGICDVTLDQSM